jgi:hypothetical protein
LAYSCFHHAPPMKVNPGLLAHHPVASPTPR